MKKSRNRNVKHPIKHDIPPKRDVDEYLQTTATTNGLLEVTGVDPRIESSFAAAFHRHSVRWILCGDRGERNVGRGDTPSVGRVLVRPHL